MLSCFPFSYSPLKDDDYAQLFIGQQDQLGEEANDNCLNINLSSVDSEALIKQTTTTTDNLPHLVNTDTELQSDQLPSHPLSSSRDSIKLPLPLPRTFRKPDTIFNVDSCHTIDSTPITTTNNTINHSTKSSLLKLGFHRSKGTEHLQQEALRKSNESNSLVLHSQRYIKLPTSSVSRFSDPTNNKSSKNCNNSINTTKSNTSLSNKPIGQNRLISTQTPIPKPPLSKSLGLSSSSAPSCSLLGSPKPTSEPSPKPPPRPLTSHPGLGIATMPRQKVQFSSVNTSDSPTSSLNDNNVSSNTTGETSLAANASSVTRNGSQPASAAALVPSTSSTSSSTAPDWSKAGSFINKPPRGWLHPDQQIAETGISYAVRVCYAQLPYVSHIF